FHLGDMETSDFTHHSLIISNFALQWLDHLEKFLYKSYFKSNVFAFSCLLDGTFKEWRDILKNYGLPLTDPQYPTEEELINFLTTLEASKQQFNSKCFVLEFSNPY